MEARLSGLDYGIIGGYLVFALSIGFILGRKASQSLTQYLAAGRELPGGKPADILWGFRSLYGALVVNSIVMGWVIHAMVKIIRTTFGWEPLTALTVLIAITFLYTLAAGLLGIVLTDFLQFALAMTGAIWLALAALVGH
ncbi:MAG: hypothetical protein SLRJCFUN_001197 [Candidatus Fervidibacter sp.]